MPSLTDTANACRDEAARTCCPELCRVLLDAARALDGSSYIGPCLVCADRRADRELAGSGLCRPCYQRHRRATRKD